LGLELPNRERANRQHGDREASSAGETTIALVAAAVGSAIFDATDLRIRTVLFAPGRVKAAFSQE
jgi:nicotinate dehydrogenase subunit B